MSDPQPPPSEIITAAEAVALSRLSLSTLKRRAQEGHPIGLRRNGRRLLFVRSELLAYLTRVVGTRDDGSKKT